MPKRIAILIYRHGWFERSKCYLSEIAEVWRNKGLEVSVLQGPQPGVSADLAINHVDLTVTPSDHLDFLWQFPATINAGVADISKRSISHNLVCPGDGYDGPVIIKTNFNAGGYMESFMASKGLMPPTPFCPPDRYPIFKTARNVPSPVWDHPALVVERFLPERHNEMFCLRMWVFFGDVQTHTLCFSNDPNVKSSNMIKREPLGDVPIELQRLRKEMRFEFGKFDYGIVDGKVILHDANRTPGLINLTREQFMPRILLLAEGIRSFI